MYNIVQDPDDVTFLEGLSNAKMKIEKVFSPHSKKPNATNLTIIQKEPFRSNLKKKQTLVQCSAQQTGPVVVQLAACISLEIAPKRCFQ